MPKVPPKIVTERVPSLVQTATNDAEGAILGGPFNEYMYQRVGFVTKAEVRSAYASASPNERRLIREFTEVNTKSRIISRIHPYWFLARIKNLDTGKTFLAAGCRETAPGLSATDFLTVLGIT